MSTPNLVPRGDLTGSLGSPTKRWLSGSFGYIAGSFKGDGSGLTGITATAAPVGPNTSVQFRDSSVISGSSAFTFDKATNTVNVTGTVIATTLSGSFDRTVTVSGSFEDAPIIAQEIQYDTVYSGTGTLTHTTGKTYWDATSKTLAVDLEGSNVSLQVGQEFHIYARNITGTPITNGTVVRSTGATGNKITVEPAIAQLPDGSRLSPNPVIGIATEDILNNSNGYITTLGTINGLDTSGFIEGADIFLSHTTSGSYSITIPPAPYDKVRIGTVQRSHPTLGQVYIHPDPSTHLHDISAITGSTLATAGQALMKDPNGNDWFVFSNSYTGSFSGSFTGDTQAWAKVTVVKNSGATQYDTIGQAISASTSGDQILIGHGTYVEHDLEVPAGVRLYGKSPNTNADVTIYAVGATRYAIKLNTDSTIGNMQIIGPTAGNIPIVEASIGSLSNTINNCRILGAGNTGSIGVNITGSGGFTSILSTVFADGLGTMKMGIYHTGSARFLGRDIICAGSGTTIAEFAGSGDVEISRLISIGQFANYTNGITLSGTSTSVFSDVYLDEGVDNVIFFESGSDGSFTQIFGGEITGTTSDIKISSGCTGVGTKLHIGNVSARLEKFSNGSSTWLDNVSLLGIYLDQGVQDDNTVGILGQLSVGIPGKGAEAIFGEGDSSTLGMLVYTSGSGGWSDKTTALKSRINSIATLFPQSGSGGTLYIGNTSRKFGGLKSETTTARTGSLGIWEYYSGSTWTAFDVMATKSDAPYNSYGNRPFSIANGEHIRFNLLTSSSFGWNQTTVSGSTAYWVRHRLTGSMATSPESQRFKLHTDRTEINSDGYIEYFGAAEPNGDLIWHKEMETPVVGSSPSSTSVTFASGIELATTDNTFTSNATDGRGGIIEIPEGLDTSRPLQFEVYWYPTANGSPSPWELEFRYSLIRQGNTVGSGNASTLQTKIVSIGTSDISIMKKTTFSVIPSSLVPGDFIAFKYYRDATVGNADDTFGGSIVVTKTVWVGTFWHNN